LAAAGFALALYAPWLPQVHGTALGAYAALEPRTVHNVVVDIAKLIPGYPYARLSAIPTHVGLAIMVAFALLGLVAAGWRARRAWPLEVPDLVSGRLLIVALALATPVGVLLYSILRTDIWGARNLYASAPAGALVLGALIGALPRPARVAGVASILAVLAFGAARSVSPTYSRPPTRAAAEYLDRVAVRSAPVIIYPSFLGLTTNILAQFHHGHRVLLEPLARWPRNISARSAYLVMDDAVALVQGIPVPHPSGYALVSRRHYRGLMNFTVLGYRRLS